MYLVKAIRNGSIPSKYNISNLATQMDNIQNPRFWVGLLFINGPSGIKRKETITCQCMCIEYMAQDLSRRKAARHNAQSFRALFGTVTKGRPGQTES